ncbi:MAG: hypothetical protein COA57_14780 [Flavobacteriales bacterium]|nr:MAG: hypothetical protein COA57_14780 [Flavobacteriales bacterium]
MISFLFFFILIIISIDANAQCAMCRAAIESSHEHGETIGQGLNTGILYLMGIPYLLLVGMGVYLFRNLKRQN